MSAMGIPSARSPDAAQRNPGDAALARPILDSALLHPGYWPCIKPTNV